MCGRGNGIMCVEGKKREWELRKVAMRKEVLEKEEEERRRENL